MCIFLQCAPFTSYSVFALFPSRRAPPGHIILNKCPLIVFAEKQEKEVDIYASLSDEKAFVFSVALAEINRKILGQRLIL